MRVQDATLATCPLGGAGLPTQFLGWVGAINPNSTLTINVRVVHNLQVLSDFFEIYRSANKFQCKWQLLLIYFFGQLKIILS